MKPLVAELIENPRRLRICSVKGAGANTFYPDPMAAATGTMFGLNTSGTIFGADDEVVIFSFRVNSSAILATATLEATDGSNICSMQMTAGGGGDGELNAPIYIKGGFRVTTNNPMALSIVYAVVR